MDFIIGDINLLKVKRKSDIGYMLINDLDEEVLLHFNEIDKNLEIDEEVEVYLYFDSKKRLSATTKKPNIKINEIKFLKVLSVIDNLGIFLDNNISKDLIVSIDDLPFEKERWPKENDELLVKLKNTDTQLIGKLVSKEEAKEKLVETKSLDLNDEIDAIVIRTGKSGINLITKNFNHIFVYYKHLRKEYRLGEVVQVKIINIKEDKTYNGTTLKTIVENINNDSETIYNYIISNNGYINFTSKTDIKLIEETFKMSKSAFKKAVGKLYKERKIEIKNDGLYLVK